MKRKPKVYDREQHELICAALGVSTDPKAPGLTAYEGVCVLLRKVEVATVALKELDRKPFWVKVAIEELETPLCNETSVIKCYG